jgi:hypothetical protein
MKAAGVAALGLVLAAAFAAPARAQSGEGVPRLAITSRPPGREAIAAAQQRAIAWLLGAQNGDGSWGSARNTTYHDVWPNFETHRGWTVATTGLVVMALVRDGAERARPAAERGVDYVLANHDLRRCDSWDIDQVWGLLYGMQGLAVAVRHPWFAAGERRAAMGAAIESLLARIAAYQSPKGGWGYYTDQVDAWLPEWSTSFTTAAMVDALLDAKAAGFAFDEKRLAAALRAIERCRLPGGAFTYDVMAIPEPGMDESINDVRGSLSRIQVCNHALRRGGRTVSDETAARGLDLFFRRHMYLDCARMRPIPHEAYHRNAGYFYLFGHFYAGELLPTLPPAQRRGFAGMLAFEVMKTQEPSGAAWDYWLSDYTRSYGTAYAAMALARARDALDPPAQ